MKAKTMSTLVDKAFVDKLNEVVFEMGNITYTRQEMIDHLHCANFAAAVKISTLLRRLDMGTIAQVVKHDPASILRVRGIGMASMYVLMCVLDAKGQDVERWWKWTANSVVKFSTYKHNVARRAKKRGAHAA